MGGCASVADLHGSRGDEATQSCVAAFEAVDARIDAEGVRDAQDSPITGFPYLRVSRVLERLAPQIGDARFEAWIDHLAGLDRDARRFELSNLSAPGRAALDQRFPSHANSENRLEECRRQLVSRDRSSADRKLELRSRAVVPSDYATWKRILGLYPLTSLVFAAGIKRFEEQTQQSFDAFPADRFATARDCAGDTLLCRKSPATLTRYAPEQAKSLTPAAVRALIERAPPDPLGLQMPVGSDRDDLFAAFAPELVIDEEGRYDRIGALHWAEPHTLAVDVSTPVAYTRIAHTLVGGRALLQLVYTFWFPERPADSRFDVLSGHLDGLVWRVTLTPDGEPWIFDSIHPCGCYHHFFPTVRAQPRPAPNRIEEWAFSPQRLPRLLHGERVTVHLAARTHYVRKIETTAHARASQPYRLLDDDVLRSLPLPGEGQRSAFEGDGLIRGTERAERFFFWPMGIANPGAMRQWGRHATAFVGERHFDDADLLAQRFLLLDAAEPAR